MTVPFIKMHGLGNEFVIFDKPVALTREQIQRIADRRSGIGCDQIIVMEPSQSADIFIRIYNADGSEVDACGNATRCIGWLMAQELHKQAGITIETKADILKAHIAGDHLVTVDMGIPRLTADAIPIAGSTANAAHITYGSLKDGMAVGMGNPHIIFFVEDANTPDLDAYGKTIEHRTDIFPERVNVSAAQIIAPGHIRLRVWERGAGFTLACGTAACATLVAAHSRGLTGRTAKIDMPGGTLTIEWREDNHVWMTGAVAESARGEVVL